LISTVGIKIEMLTYFSEKWFEILTLLLKYGTEIGTPMLESKFRLRNRNQNRNSDVEIETEIEIPIWISKPKAKFQFQHQNFDKIRTKFCRNFDFLKSKQSKS
jgi:hypothetical protein